MMLAVEQRLKDMAIPGLTVMQQTSYEVSDCIGEDLPLALLVVGRHKYQPPETTGDAQERIKTIGISLIARADEVDSLEDEIVRALIGWQVDSYHLPVQVLESDTKGIRGDLYERALVFGIRSVIRPRA